MGKTPLSTSLLAGATAGVAASLVLQPLDYAKTQQQALVRAQGLQSPPTLRQTMISTIRSDGIRALWSGLGPSVARASIGPGLYFGLLNQMTTSKIAIQLSESNRMAVSFFCSATSRALAGVLLNPVSVVKTRFEWHGKRQRGIESRNTYHALRTIVREEGLAGLSRGLSATIVRDVPFSGLYYLVYQDLLKPFAASQQSHHDLKVPAFVVNSLCAFVAGAFATVATHPADMVKTQQQLLWSTKENPAMQGRAQNNPEGAFQLAKLIVETKGIRGLFAGLTARIVRRPISVAITWGIYEYLVPILQ